jgi:hypothetical protein
MSVYSSSALDTSDGDGVRKVTVVYQDVNRIEQRAEVTMNGQAGVALPSDVWRVYRAWSGEVGAGATGTNVGDIWIGNGTVTGGVPANKFAHIAAGRGQTLMALYTIPSFAFDSEGDLQEIEKAKILRWGGQCGANKEGFASAELRTRVQGEAWRSRDVLGFGAGTPPNEFAFGKTVAPGTDIEVYIIDNVEINTSIQAGFDIALIVKK